MRQSDKKPAGRRRIGALCALSIAFAAAGTGLASAAQPPPNSMASLGDSITRAFTDCGTLGDCPNESWSTGGDPAVMSQYLRILAINPAISGANYNVAVTGAKVSDLAGEAAAAAADGVDYLTVLIGANDACTDTVADMTPVTTFRADFKQALDVVSTSLPNARVFVSSVPDVYRLWQLASPNAQARAVWALAKICQSLLANPLSMTAADEARRQAVLQRVMDYNAQMEQECALHAHCKFDGDAVFNHRFSLGDIGTIDYFHPSVKGQTTLARVTWRAGFRW
jgi:lysophospholipase L1-like esterase